MGQANRSENNNIGLLFSRLTILATPCAISSAVSKDSVNRRAISGLTVNLSTTASIVFFFFESIVGKSSISYIFWLILSLMKYGRMISSRVEYHLHLLREVDWVSLPSSTQQKEAKPITQAGWNCMYIALAQVHEGEPNNTSSVDQSHKFI